MTVMDKIEGWEEEEWVGSRCAACMRIYTKAVLCDGQESTQEYLRQRFVAIRESVSWVCEDALVDHACVTELTISMQENEVLVALNYEIDEWSSGDCCDSRRIRDLIKDSWIMTQKLRNTTKF